MIQPCIAPVGARVHAIGATEMLGQLDELAAILVDAVAGGASVNFMAGFPQADARAFWRGQVAGVAGGGTVLLAADDGERLVGTLLLTLAHQPNAPHRADVGKMLVLSGFRRRGLGRRLLAAAEGAARSAGRSLLMLDTESGSAGDLLYRSCGWVECGRVPDHSFRPDGRLAETTLFFKALGPHGRGPDRDARNG